MTKPIRSPEERAIIWSMIVDLDERTGSLLDRGGPGSVAKTLFDQAQELGRKVKEFDEWWPEEEKRREDALNKITLLDRLASVENI